MNVPLFNTLVTIGCTILGGIIIHAFYFGSLLGKMLSTLKHIEEALTRNDKEHDSMWERINHLSDTVKSNES